MSAERIDNKKPFLQKLICSLEKPGNILVTGYNTNQSQFLFYKSLFDHCTIESFSRSAKKGFGRINGEHDESSWSDEEENEEDKHYQTTLTRDKMVILDRTFKKRIVKYYFYDTNSSPSRLDSMKFHYSQNHYTQAMIFIMKCPFCEFIKNQDCCSKESPDESSLSKQKASPSIERRKVAQSFDVLYKNGYKENRPFISSSSDYFKMYNFFFEHNDEVQGAKNYYMNYIYHIGCTVNNDSLPTIMMLVDHYDGSVTHNLKSIINDAVYDGKISGFRCPWVNNKKKLMSVDADTDAIFRDFMGFGKDETDSFYCKHLPPRPATGNINQYIAQHGITKKTKRFITHTSIQVGYNIDNVISLLQEFVFNS